MAAKTGVLHFFGRHFHIVMADNSVAVLKYKRVPNRRVLDFNHTEVPPDFRGQGFAEQLVRAGFRHCLDTRFSVYPSCTYVQKYIRDLATEEEKKIVVEKYY
ncbi:hypothetical protein niasHT_017511 [Heterodera trifolii]|uniref:Protein NATD1 n=1 Tax=Heterodera trifolii TaxID=157864 RepID=A0ABD2L5X8_9BILA